MYICPKLDVIYAVLDLEESIGAMAARADRLEGYLTREASGYYSEERVLHELNQIENICRDTIRLSADVERKIHENQERRARRKKKPRDGGLHPGPGDERLEG